MTERTARDDDAIAVAPAADDRTIPDRRLMALGLLGTLIVAAFGMDARHRMLVTGLVRPSSSNIFCASAAGMPNASAMPPRIASSSSCTT